MRSRMAQGFFSFRANFFLVPSEFFSRSEGIFGGEFEVSFCLSVRKGAYPRGALAGSIGFEFRKTISEIWGDPFMLSLPASPILSLNTT